MDLNYSFLGLPLGSCFGACILGVELEWLWSGLIFLLLENVRHHRWLPSLFRAPLLQDQQDFSIFPGSFGYTCGAKGGSLVVCTSPSSPSPLWWRTRYPFTASKGFLVVSSGVDLNNALRRNRLVTHQGFRQVSWTQVSESLRVSSRYRFCSPLVHDRGFAIDFLGLYYLHRTSLAWHVLHQFIGPPHWEAPLQNRRWFEEFHVPCADYHGGRLAQ